MSHVYLAGVVIYSDDQKPRSFKMLSWCIMRGTEIIQIKDREIAITETHRQWVRELLHDIPEHPDKGFERRVTRDDHQIVVYGHPLEEYSSPENGDYSKEFLDLVRLAVMEDLAE